MTAPRGSTLPLQVLGSCRVALPRHGLTGPAGLSCSITTSALGGKLYVCLSDQGYSPSTGGVLRGPGNVGWNYARTFEGQVTDAAGFGPWRWLILRVRLCPRRR